MIFVLAWECLPQTVIVAIHCAFEKNKIVVWFIAIKKFIFNLTSLPFLTLHVFCAPVEH